MVATQQDGPGPLGRWRQRRAARQARREAAHRLYGAVVELARRPHLYAVLGVPDDVDGRFEMVALHAALVMRRLAAGGPAATALGQELFDLMFADMDRTLRELGVGDLSIGKRVKALAATFLARARALEEALGAGDEAALVAILERNLGVGGGGPDPTQRAALARHLVALDRHLAAIPLGELLEGRLSAPAA
jgi:cytochrome b pre-mRNA-processing protein 3